MLHLLLLLPNNHAMVLGSKCMSVRPNHRYVRHHLASAIQHALHFLLILELPLLDLLLVPLLLQEFQLSYNAGDDTLLDDVDLGHVEHDEEEVQLGHGRVLHHDEGRDVLLQARVLEADGRLPESLDHLLLSI